MSDVIEVEAEVVEPAQAPQLLGEADRWLAEATDEVAKAVASGDFEAFPVQSEEDYKQAKRTRTALNAKVNGLETQRKDMTRAVESAIKAFKDEAKGVLDPLRERQAALKEAIDGYEHECEQRRWQALCDEYLSFAGELADMVAFATIDAKYSKAGKWYLRSTSEPAAVKSLHEAVLEVADRLRLIDGMPYPDERRRAIKAKYAVSLDYEQAQRDEQAEWDAYLAAEAHRAAEAERQAQMAEQARLEAERMAQQAAAKPEPMPEPMAEPMAQVVSVREVFEVEFRARLDEDQLAGLRGYINACGIKAKFRRL